MTRAAYLAVMLFLLVADCSSPSRPDAQATAGEADPSPCG